MKLRFFGVAVLLLSVVAIPLFSQKTRSPTKDGNAKLVARGKYLVEQVGMCQDCHTPMNEKGEHVREKWLQGAPILFKPTVPLHAWGEHAVRIAGLPGWTDEQAITFLMTGKNPRGTSPRPPMPPYRFSREDAAAVTAYLRSVGTEAATAETGSATSTEQ